MSDLSRIDHLGSRLSPLILTTLLGGVARRVDQRMHEGRFDRAGDDAVHTDAFVHQVGCDAQRHAVDRTFGCRIRSEEHTSELQSLMRISYAVFCLKKKKKTIITQA